MTILDDLLSTIDYKAPVRDLRQGPFQTAVLTSGCGLASTPHDNGPHHQNVPVKEAGLLLTKDAEMLAHLARSESPLEAAIGMATVNSLLEVDEGRCIEVNAADLLFVRGEDKKVAIVGHFPFIPRLRKVAREFWVIEKNPREGDFPESEAGDLIPGADVVGITGMAFVNHTIDDLLGMCRHDSCVVVLGGTAPLSPVLFDYGVDFISGTIVTDPETVLRYVSQGAFYRQLKGLRRLTMTRERN
jgi:uncharacterized protein (DUF4213/DUF364 family)